MEEQSVVRGSADHWCPCHHTVTRRGKRSPPPLQHHPPPHFSSVTPFVILMWPLLDELTHEGLNLIWLVASMNMTPHPTHTANSFIGYILFFTLLLIDIVIEK